MDHNNDHDQPSNNIPLIKRRHSLYNPPPIYLEILAPDAVVYDHMRAERPYMRMDRHYNRAQTRSLDLTIYSENSYHYTTDKENCYDQIVYEEVATTTKNGKIKLCQMILFTSVVVGLFILMGIIAWMLFVKQQQQPITEDEIPFYTIVVPEYNETSLEYKRQFVRNMTRHSWNGYVRYAWGNGFLAPVSKEAQNYEFGPNSGYTLVAAMSTLHVMKLKEEFEKGKQWIESKWNFTKLDEYIKVPETIIQYLGSFLSCYALTGDAMFLKKAHQLLELLEPAFKTSTGLLFYKVNPARKLTFNFWIIGSNELYLANTHLPELVFLAQLSNTTTLARRLAVAKQFVQNLPKKNGLYQDEIDVRYGKYTNLETTIINMGILMRTWLNLYIQSEKNDTDSMKMYQEALEAIQKGKLLYYSDHGLLFARDLADVKSNKFKKFMHKKACQLGAILALGSGLLANGTLQQHHLELAQNLTYTCHQAAQQTVTKLSPFKIVPSTNGFVKPISIENPSAIISHELAESYFILWRITYQQKYREYAWQLVKALYNHARTEAGYTNLFNANDPTEKADDQPAEFLSGTLKYLFLIFCEDNVLPLDQWIFNEVGHPLPICGQHPLYPADLCASSNTTTTSR